MALGETLEKLFGQEHETSVESAALELITSGDNIESKTILPATRYPLAFSFLQRLSQDIDEEMDEVTAIHNQNRINYMKLSNKDFKPTKANYRYQHLSDNIIPILNKTMVLMPSMRGLARDQFTSVLKWLREEKSKQQKPDSLTAMQNYLNR